MSRFKANANLVLLFALLMVLNSGGTVGSAPFKTDKLAVLVVEESTPGDEKNAPVWVNSTKPGGVRDYVEGRKGKFHLLDQQNPTDIAGDDWKAAMAVERKSLPWIVAAGPRTGFSKPLPATAAETLKLLEGVK